MPDAGSPAGNGSSPGNLLAAGRASRELTIEEVGDALNLAPQTVQWLESDNFEELPAAAFTQGYIRNYAKLVGLDQDAVVGAYHAKAGKPDVAWESPRPTGGLSDIVTRHPGVLISALVAAVGLLILVVLLVVWPDDQDDSEASANAVAPLDAALQNGGRVAGTTADPAAPQFPQTTAAEPVETVQPTTVNSARPGARFDTPQSAAGNIDRDAIDPNDPLAHLPLAKTVPVSEFNSGSTGEPVNSSDSGQGNSSASIDDSDAAQSSARLTPSGDDVIRFEVIEDCWIAIKTIDNVELYGRLGRAGQSIALTGQAPFRVVLGYAPGAQLYLNDRQIQLDRYTRNNVASLVIGQ